MQVVHNALAVLEEIARRQPVTLAELHRVLGLPKTTVHRALATLAEAGWARSSEDRRWSIAPRAAVLGARASSAGGLRELALPVMEALRDACGEAVHLTVPDGDAVVLIERIDSPRAVRTYNPVGSRAPLHASANGKAILAHLPEADRQAYLAGDIATYTRRTLSSPRRLRAELARVRRQGWARNRGEYVPDVAAVAAPIFSRDGRPIAAMSISAPADRLPEAKVPRAARLVGAAARELSALLGDVRALDGATDDDVPAHSI